MKKISRRQFGKAAAAAAALSGTSLPRIAFGQQNRSDLTFPKGFLWGCATAAYYVDYKTEKRIPKMSAAWYAQAIARNAVV